MTQDSVTTRPARQKLRASLAATAAAALFIAGIVVPSTIEPTDASWTDDELASASFSAATIPAPVLTQSCEFRPGVLGLGARVRIYWQAPDGYGLDDVVVEASTSGLGSVLAPLTGFSLLSNTTARDDGTYRTDVPTNLLGGLLGLGSELEIAFAVEHESGWQSEPAAVATNAGLLVGLGGSCRNLT